jgi:ABC-type lipoprotein export system ATPase subunit
MCNFIPNNYYFKDNFHTKLGILICVPAIMVIMQSEQFHELAILSGTNRDGTREGFSRITLCPGDTLSIVGSTGSGKSAFINDIEVLAQGDTITGRSILINGIPPSDDMVRDPSKKPIALITQNTRVIADLTVSRFLSLHIRARDNDTEELIRKTITLANEFTGEKIAEFMRMTSLSGGQTRSLLIADAILIGRTPILLLDEVENAGIFKEKVIRCLKRYNKAVIFVTHDPLLAMITDRRIVMKNGAVTSVIEPRGTEQEMVSHISGIDAFLGELREKIRAGDLILGDIPPQKQNIVPV